MDMPLGVLVGLQTKAEFLEQEDVDSLEMYRLEEQVALQMYK
jgi:hypothetical protein